VEAEYGAAAVAEGRRGAVPGIGRDRPSVEPPSATVCNLGHRARFHRAGRGGGRVRAKVGGLRELATGV